jgi:hypothetical protein
MRLSTDTVIHELDRTFREQIEDVEERSELGDIPNMSPTTAEEEMRGELRDLAAYSADFLVYAQVYLQSKGSAKGAADSELRGLHKQRFPGDYV